MDRVTVYRSTVDRSTVDRETDFQKIFGSKTRKKQWVVRRQWVVFLKTCMSDRVGLFLVRVRIRNIKKSERELVVNANLEI